MTTALAVTPVPGSGHAAAEGQLTDEAGSENPVVEVTCYKGWQPSKAACFVVGTELVCAIVVAWVVCPRDPLQLQRFPLTTWQLYIVYSLGA